MTLSVKRGFRGAAELLRLHGAVLSPGAANGVLYEAAAAGAELHRPQNRKMQLGMTWMIVFKTMDFWDFEDPYSL